MVEYFILHINTQGIYLMSVQVTVLCGGQIDMSNGNSFLVTGPLWGESTGHRWIPQTKVSDAELWILLWSVPKQTIEPTIVKAGDVRRHHRHYDVTVMEVGVTVLLALVGIINASYVTKICHHIIYVIHVLYQRVYQDRINASSIT